MAINVNMTSSNGVTLATNGKYCADNIQVIPTFNFAENAKSWEFTLTKLEPNTNGIVLKDDWLKEHCNDANLCFYAIKQTNRVNVIGNIRANDPTYICGYDGTMGGFILSNGYIPMVAKFNESSANDTGLFYVTQEGELIYKNGSEVYFTDGIYKAIAWLA